MSEYAKKPGIFGSLLLLTVFFILLQISFFIQCNKEYLFAFTFVANHLSLPRIIYPEIIFFFLVQLGLHLAGCVLVWWLVESLAKKITWIDERKFGFAIFFWCFSVFTVLVANQYFYPNSKFVVITSMFLSTPEIVKITFFLCAGLFFLALLIALSRHILSVVVLSFLIYVLYPKPHVWPPSVATSTQPNIIIVGMDSLRPDYLGYFGSKNATPFLDNFLSGATVFGEAFTPLARTFPSWASILTGEYPKETHIRSNLINQQYLNLQNSLPAILQRHGYETIYATDEVRFSNIDKNFGFDQIIAPPMGLNDFLLGTFNDFPLANLLVNTPVGKWLFPYSYANRAAYITYCPDRFLSLIKDSLNKVSGRNKPMFITAHFCLPHYGWLWAALDGEKYKPLERYNQSIMRVDKQIQGFFSLLAKHHLLDHAIVIILSDHGEGLALNGDRLTENSLFVTTGKKFRIPAFYPAMLEKEAINQSAGHGTDVLGLSQYHSLLAIQLRGMDSNHPQMLTGMVSLLDIKPTVLDLLGIKNTQSSGISLANLITGKTQQPPLRHIFLESDYSPPSIRTVYPETRDVMLQGIDLFEIDQRARLTVKKSMVDKIIKSKQLADIYGEWMLALYPQGKGVYTPILINLHDGRWTDDLDTLFAHQSPAKTMLAALHKFYVAELATADIKPFYSQPS